MPNPLRFIVIWAACLMALAIVVAAANYLIDPYEVFGAPRRAHLNLLKPAAKNHAMLAKTYQVERVRPVTVLIGSSVAHIGIDAADSAWPAELRPVFNYGIPGGYAVAVGIGALREAILTGRVKQAVAVLDFQSFLEPDPLDARLVPEMARFHTLSDGTPNPGRLAQVLQDIFLSLFTMGALIDSGITVLRQGNPNTLDLAPNGSSTESDFSNAARTDGTHDLFTQKIVFETERATGVAAAMADWQGKLPNLDVVSQIIDIAQEHNVRLVLVLAPHHAEALELYWRTGLWPRVEQLKRDLVQLVAKNDHEVVLWDFMDYSSFVAEPVPDAGERGAQTRWFWESSHFKKVLGHIMIERINGAPGPDFGAILTPGNVAAHNEQIRARRDALVCIQRQPFLASLGQAVSDECAHPGLPQYKQTGQALAGAGLGRRHR